MFKINLDLSIKINTIFFIQPHSLLETLNSQVHRETKTTYTNIYVVNFEGNVI